MLTYFNFLCGMTVCTMLIVFLEFIKSIEVKMIQCERAIQLD